jgi:hypothetical protein
MQTVKKSIRIEKSTRTLLIKNVALKRAVWDIVFSLFRQQLTAPHESFSAEEWHGCSEGLHPGQWSLRKEAGNINISTTYF